MTGKKHVSEINIMRAIAMIAVVMIHSTGNPAIQLEPASSFKWLYIFLNNFCAFAVPLFIFISGFVMFYTYRDQPFNKQTIVTFYKKRFTNILLPYFIFSLFYFVLHSYKNNIDLHILTIVKTFAYQFFTGAAHTHLYFMFVIIQFYIVFPIFLFMLKNEQLSKHMLWISSLAQWAYYYLNREIISHMNWLPDIFHQKASFFLSYLTFFILGAIMAFHFDALRSWFAIKIWSNNKIAAFWIVTTGLWIMSGLYYVHINYNAIAWNNWAHVDVFQWTWFCFCLLSALVIFRLSKWIYTVFPSSFVSALTHLGICSFGVYLIHPFFLTLWRFMPVSNSPYLFHLYYFGIFTVALGVSWLITGFVQKNFSWSWIIFGTASKKRTPVKQQTFNQSA